MTRFESRSDSATLCISQRQHPNRSRHDGRVGRHRHPRSQWFRQQSHFCLVPGQVAQSARQSADAVISRAALRSLGWTSEAGSFSLQFTYLGDLLFPNLNHDCDDRSPSRSIDITIRKPVMSPLSFAAKNWLLPRNAERESDAKPNRCPPRKTWYKPDNGPCGSSVGDRRCNHDVMNGFLILAFFGPHQEFTRPG